MKTKVVEVEQCSGPESKLRSAHMKFDEFAKIYPHLVKSVDLNSEKPAWGKAWYAKNKKTKGINLVKENWDTSG